MAKSPSKPLSNPSEPKRPGEVKLGKVILGRNSSRKGSFREAPVWVPGDPEAVRPVVPGETYPLFAAAIVLGVIALFVCYRHGYLLLYGDAVAIADEERDDAE